MRSRLQTNLNFAVSVVFAGFILLSPEFGVATVETCTTAFSRLVRSAKVTEQDVLRLRREIKQPVKTIKNLAVSSETIRTIVKTHEGGAFALIAVEVETDQGLKFLKIYDDSKLRSSAYTQVIQNAMARKGMAPMIGGYLAPEQVKNLIARFPALAKSIALDERATSFGILMDPIDVVANISKHRTGAIPAEWTKTKLEKRVREFEDAMSDLRIIPAGDLQAAIDREGHFLLYDFDGYGHVTNGHQVFSTESQQGQRSYDDFMERTYRHDLEWAEQEPSDIFRIDGENRFNVRLSGLRNALGLPR